MLTPELVATIKTAGEHHDSRGLYLQISKNGGRSWVYVFGLHGKRHKMGLGPADTISLNEARVLRDRARHRIKLGRNPIEERRRLRERGLRQSKQPRDSLLANKDPIRDPQVVWPSGEATDASSAGELPNEANSLTREQSPELRRVMTALATLASFGFSLRGGALVVPKRAVVKLIPYTENIELRISVYLSRGKRLKLTAMFPPHALSFYPTDDEEAASSAKTPDAKSAKGRGRSE
jgi:hypothetical protein